MKKHDSRITILAILLSVLSLFVMSCAVKNESPNQNSSGNSNAPATGPTGVPPNQNSSGNANAQATPPGGIENRNATGVTKQGREVGDTSPDEFVGTTGSTNRSKGKVAPALLREVRLARQANFDRIVFEFAGKEIPNYAVSYAAKPITECGSGNPVNMMGDGLLQVSFESTNAHNEAGEPTVADRRRRLNFPMLRELRFTCDFEAQVVVVVGVVATQPYRVLDLYNPTRVVVDVKH